MFFYFPISSDAPIYHWPYATVGLIVVNVITFILTGGGYTQEGVQPWMLEYGHFNLIECVSSHFIHFGIEHILYNMLFLWSFGIIVEGKIGWWRMLVSYLGIGIVGGIIIQIVMLGYNGPVTGAGGASLAVFGIMAIGLVWAPKNNIEFAYFFWIFFFLRTGLAQIPVIAVSIFYLGLNFAFASYSAEMGIGSEIAHLIGAGLGFGLGVLLLKLNKVDCEGWDLFAVFKGNAGEQDRKEGYHYTSAAFEAERAANRKRFGGVFGSSSDDDVEKDDDVMEERRGKRKVKAIKKIRLYLEENNPHAALHEYEQLKHYLPDWQLSEKDLAALIDGLYKSRDWENSAKLMTQFLERYPESNPRIRLQYAALMVEVQERPRFALEIIEPLKKKKLTEKYQQFRLRVQKKAEQMIDDGVLELDGQSWR